MIEQDQKEIGILVKKGRYFAAFNQAERALQNDPDNYKIRQLYGLSLAKLGLFEKAKSVLWDLYNDHSDDPETAGVLGGVLKSVFKKNKSKEDAKLSRDIYLENYRKNKNYYTGINAASMSVVIGETTVASEIAGEIIKVLSTNSNDFQARRK